MKKLLFILFISLVACKKVEIRPEPTATTKDIFSVSQSTVSNGADITITLKSSGIYTLTMGDSITSQVITRERFTGKVGENKLKIYTSSLPVKYLYLLLEDESKTQIGKTIITIN
jgi:hypothetical protein